MIVITKALSNTSMLFMMTGLTRQQYISRLLALVAAGWDSRDVFPCLEMGDIGSIGGYPSSDSTQHRILACMCHHLRRYLLTSWRKQRRQYLQSDLLLVVGSGSCELRRGRRGHWRSHDDRHVAMAHSRCRIGGHGDKKRWQF
jgi:hypothetical protein